MNIESKVVETIAKYKLLGKKEKIVVALSGGKDSTSVLYILKKLGYDVHGLMIDLHLGNWSKMHLKNMERFCSELGVKLNVVDLKKELGSGICFIKQVVKQKKNLTGCSVCGVVKKWVLNKWAKKLKADKIVTGHNLDDECQTVLMNFLKGNVFLGAGSGPATGFSFKDGDSTRSAREILTNKKSSNGKHKQTVDILTNLNGSGNKQAQSLPKLLRVSGFVQRVKPFFFIPEDEIRKYAKKKKFDINYERCPCAFGTYRVETRSWLDALDDKQKLKIVLGFQKLIPKLKRKQITEVFECKNCGEPARGEVCNFCKVISCL